MRASKHVATIDQDPPTKASLLWPIEAIEGLQCESMPPQELSPKPTVNDQGDDVIIDSEDEVSDEDTEGTAVAELSGSTATTILRPNLRRSKVGGKPPKRGTKAAGKAADDKITWEACADKLIGKCSDFELAEYLIGTSCRLTLSETYWPGDKGEWKVECSDAEPRGVNDDIALECTLISGPRRPTNNERVVIWMSEHNGKDFSARRAIRENYPRAKTPRDIYREQAHWARVFGERPAGESIPQSRESPVRNQIVYKSTHAFLVLSMIQQVAWAATVEISKGLTSPLSPEPKNQRDARKRPDFLLWLAAEEKEVNTLIDKKTYVIVDLPDGVVELGSMFQYKQKTGPNGEKLEQKARLCARGDQQTSAEYGETFTPTSRFAVLRLIIALATQQNLMLKHWDIRGAFLCADLDEDIYVRLPPGHEPPLGKTAKLLKSLYGLRQAPACFHHLLEKWLLKYGFTPIGADRVTFQYQKGKDIIILSLYVDDGLAATNNDTLYAKFLEDLGNEFELSACGELTWYLGVKVTQNLVDGTTFIGQQQYVKQLLERFSMSECTSATTAMSPNTRMLHADCPAVGKGDKKLTREYQQLVGALLYLSAWTRPDIAFAVNQAAKFMSNPGANHMVAAKRILRYLKGTAHLGITYTRRADGKANLLWGFADADHAGDPDTRRSVTGYVNMMNGGAISWSSTRQAIVALSSSEAEFYAASNSGCDVSHLRGLMSDLGHAQPIPTPVFEDNWACIYLSRNAVMHNKSKHIDVRVYHLRDLVKAGIMQLVKVSTGEQVADAFTKSLPEPAFKKHREVMLGNVEWEMDDECEDWGVDD